MTGRPQDAPVVFLLQRLPTFVCFSMLPAFEREVLLNCED